ncbi:MAG: 50S ribosomal protein L13 [Sumerlaeia bacterium]
MKAQSSTLPRIADMKEKWYLVDAEGEVVGRVASRVAKLLRGKLEPTYTPHINPQVHVVVINADKAVFTGRKTQDKVYYHHSGYRTGIKAITAEKLFIKCPEDVIRNAVHGMLPKNALGRVLNKNMRVYAGAEHPHDAQQPQALKFATRKPKRSDD